MTVLPETLPSSVVRAESLMSRSDAITAMHFPERVHDVALARERLGFEELFQMLLASQLNKQANQKLSGVPIPFDQAAVKILLRSCRLRSQTHSAALPGRLCKILNRRCR